jgi:Rrf2 family protein
MRLTKQTAYAIRILTHCALEPGRYIKASEIAKRHGITEHNVAKVVPLLVQGGFVESARGRAGGIRLARPAADIGLGDVVRAIEETKLQADSVSVVAADESPPQPGLINPLLDRALQAFISVLDTHSLEDLAARQRPEPPQRGEGASEAQLYER